MHLNSRACFAHDSHRGNHSLKPMVLSWYTPFTGQERYGADPVCVCVCVLHLHAGARWLFLSCFHMYCFHIVAQLQQAGF